MLYMDWQTKDGEEGRRNRIAYIPVPVSKEIETQISIHKIENEEVEMIWLQYKQRKTRDLYLGLYYGKQESRTTREEIEEEMSTGTGN